MAQGPSDTILVAIQITLRIRESKVRNLDPPDRRRFVLFECILVVVLNVFSSSIAGDTNPATSHVAPSHCMHLARPTPVSHSYQIIISSRPRY